MFLQSIRYSGDYKFADDVLLSMPRGVTQALKGPQSGSDYDGNPFEPLLPQDKPVCHKPPDRGPCKGLFERFYFDEKTGQCREFDWGGCQGSVPFETQKECEAACVPPKPQ